MPDRSAVVRPYPSPPSSSKASPGQALSTSQRRGNHKRQTSRNTQLNFRRFRPANFPQADGASAASAPQTTYSRTPPAAQVESPRLLWEGHGKFLQQAQLSPKLAASLLSVIPDPPRLDPSSSPKGTLTPLALEEGDDYISAAGAANIFPATSPGTPSPQAPSVQATTTTPNQARDAKSPHRQVQSQRSS